LCFAISSPRSHVSERFSVAAWNTRMLALAGSRVFSQPEICSGDQPKISLLATMLRNLRLTGRRHCFGRRAESQAWSSAAWAR